MILIFSFPLILSIVISAEEVEMQKNVFGDPLKLCSQSPLTGKPIIKWDTQGKLGYPIRCKGEGAV